ncbi:acyltransferase family protein [Bacillus pumilus]|uniref:acyltransferase family protein n=1 Tax=Bacillus pumilus TaxID=1408 RepID=UPI0031F5ADC7
MQIKEIYFIRSISCICVMLIHAIGILFESNSSPYSIFLMFSTPSFIFISEFLIAHSYPNGIPKGFLKKRFQFIFLPFVSVGILDALLLTNHQSKGGSIYEFFTRVSSNIFLGNYIGYFVLVIFQFYILHILFHRVLKKVSPKWVLPISFFVTIIYLYSIQFFHFPISLPNPYVLVEWIPFPAWLFYFCLAYYCGQNYHEFINLLNRFRYGIYLLLLISIALISSNTFLGLFESSSKRPDVLLYTTSIIFLFFHLFSKVQKIPSIVMLVSKYSFSIYLFHSYFLGIALLALPNIKNSHWLVTLITISLISVSSSILTSFLVNRFKYGYIFVGKVNQPKAQKSS